MQLSILTRHLAPLLLLLVAGGARAETMTLEQILQQVLDYYPSLHSAALEVQKAEKNTAVVESSLGWMLNGSAGIARDTSFIGAAVTRIDANGSMGRKLASGDSLSLSAGLSREDAETPLSSSLPNPVTSTSIELGYRMPLERGDDNPDYQLGLQRAEQELSMARARRQGAYDELAARIIDICLAALVTRERITNMDAAIKRTHRLQQLIRGRFNLGIAEDKDTLQVRAQLDNQQAQLKELELAWTRQQIALNRLMGMTWNRDLTLSIPQPTIPEGTLEDFLNESQARSPALVLIKSRIALADTAIAAREDLNRDQLDLVSFIGNRGSFGDSAFGNADNNQWVGGVRIEYQGKTDRSGDLALLEQIQLDKAMALEDQRQTLQDLHYDLASLLAEIRGLQTNLEAWNRSLDSEQAKLKEANQRYRRGRIDIDFLIQFENQLSATELTLSLQRIELIRRLYGLNLTRGVIWNQVRLPEAVPGEAP